MPKAARGGEDIPCMVENCGKQLSMKIVRNGIMHVYMYQGLIELPKHGQLFPTIFNHTRNIRAPPPSMHNNNIIMLEFYGIDYFSPALHALLHARSTGPSTHHRLSVVALTFA